MDPLDPFFARYEQDLQDGGPRSLAEYQGLWPEHADAIAEVYRELRTTQVVDPGVPWWDPSAHPLEVLGPYRIIAPLGAGGMGAVYLAEQDLPSRKVALKVLRPECISGIALKRFEHEAELLGRVQHPCIAQIYEAGRATTSWGEVPYIAMQYIDGEPMSKRIAATRADTLAERGHAPVTEPSVTALTRADQRAAISLLARVARALHAAHEAGVIHRDVKPANIMVTADEDPFVVDFGIAHDEAGQLATLTRTGDAPGTPLYMAPEQVTGGRIDRRTDVWGLGVTLHEALTGVQPFVGATSDLVRHAILHAELPPAARLARRFHLPRDLAVIIETALRKEADRRYATAAALADDLEAWHAGRPISARPLSLVGRGIRWARREPLAASLLALLLLTLPTIAVMVTRHLDNLPKLEEQARAERLTRRDRILSRAFFELGEGDKDRAWDLCEQARSLDPESVEAVAGGVLALHAAGLHEQALRHLDAHAGLLDARPVGNRLRRYVLRAAARNDELASLPPPRPPQDAIDHFVVGQILLSMGHHESAASQVSPRFRQAMDSFRRATLLSPERHGLYLNEVAHAAVHLKDRDSCARLADVLTRRWPQSSSSMRWAGMAHHAAGHTEKAVASLHRAIALDPGWYEPRVQLGRILMDAGRLAEAEAPLRAAIEYERNAFTTFNLAHWSHKNGDLDTAIRAYREIIEEWPGAQPPRYNLALALDESGDPAASVEVFREFVARWPRWKWAWMNLGRVQRKLGRNADAEKTLRAWLERAPKDPTGWTNLGSILVAQKRFTEALEAYDKALRLDPDDLDAWLGKAAAHWTRNVDGAIAAYREAVRCDPGRADAWMYLGRLLQRKSAYDEARRAFERALSVSPRDWTGRRDTQKRLRLTRQRMDQIDEVRAVIASGRVPTHLGRLRVLAQAAAWDHRFALAASWYRDVFQDPGLLETPVQGWRGQAASCAAKAGSGEGVDAGLLTAEERRAWRQQALEWLRADLAWWRVRIEAGEVKPAQVAQGMSRMLTYPWLDCIREPRRIARLPDDERREWTRFWDDVRALRNAR